MFFDITLCKFKQVCLTIDEFLLRIDFSEKNVTYIN